MTNSIIQQHNALYTQFKNVDEFIKTKYAKGERVTLKELARAVKVPLAQAEAQLARWVENTIRYDHQSNSMHMLCIFYSAEHVRPRELLNLSLTAKEKSSIHQASRTLHMPDFTYVKMYKQLLTTLRPGVMDVIRQLTLVEAAIKTGLQLMQQIGVDEEFRIIGDITDAVYHPTTVTGNLARQPCFANENVMASLKWGCKSIEKHEQDKLIDPTIQEIICLAPDNETPERRLIRKKRCNMFNQYIADQAKLGLRLTAVTTVTPYQTPPEKAAGKDARYPVFHFTNMEDAMIEVAVHFKSMAGIGKFILN